MKKHPITLVCDLNQPVRDRMASMTNLLCAQCDLSLPMTCEVTQGMAFDAALACCEMEVECERTGTSCCQMTINLNAPMTSCMIMTLAGYLACMSRELECEALAMEAARTS